MLKPHYRYLLDPGTSWPLCIDECTYDGFEELSPPGWSERYQTKQKLFKILF